MSIQHDKGSNEPNDQNGTSRWKGLAEIDQAIHENRLTEYRVKKAWADPWIRFAAFLVAMLFIAFFVFVIWQDVI